MQIISKVSVAEFNRKTKQSKKKYIIISLFVHKQKIGQSVIEALADSVPCLGDGKPRNSRETAPRRTRRTFYWELNFINQYPWLQATKWAMRVLQLGGFILAMRILGQHTYTEYISRVGWQRLDKKRRVCV